MVRGLELERVVLGRLRSRASRWALYQGCAAPLGDRLHYLNSGNNRFWFDTRPNLRREMEERKRRFQDKEDVFPAVRDRVQRELCVRCVWRHPRFHGQRRRSR
ncbi:MAG: hypothetical protein V5B44_05400 [Candidatus Accumulibacter necessarius]